MDQITEIIQKEIDKQVQQKMTAFIEHISRTYDISMKVLLRDLMRTDPPAPEKHSPTGVQCMGVCANRKRCKFSAGSNGYCKKHTDQWKPPPPQLCTPSKVCPVIKHTHTIPPLYDPNCPACVKKVNAPKDKLLINI